MSVSANQLAGADVSRWLRDQREDKGLARRAVSVYLDVAEKTVERWEDPATDALPPADKFLSLVKLYHAEKKLLVLIGTWEQFSSKGAGDAGQQRKAGGD